MREASAVHRVACEQTTELGKPNLSQSPTRQCLRAQPKAELTARPRDVHRVCAEAARRQQFVGEPVCGLGGTDSHMYLVRLRASVLHAGHAETVAVEHLGKRSGVREYLLGVGATEDADLFERDDQTRKTLGMAVRLQLRADVSHMVSARGWLRSAKAMTPLLGPGSVLCVLNVRMSAPWRRGWGSRPPAIRPAV